MPQTIWGTDCNGWHLVKDGLPDFFPWRPARDLELLRAPDIADFEVRIG